MSSVNSQFSNVDKVIAAIKVFMAEAKSESWNLPIKASSDYKLLLQQNIMSEKYSTSEWAYSESYQEFKDKTAPNQPYWKLSSDLFNSIEDRKSTGRSRYVGVPVNARNGEGNKIGLYALQMEYGSTGKHNQKPRPVFGPSLIEYFDGKFQVVMDKSVLKLLSAWR